MRGAFGPKLSLYHLSLVDQEKEEKWWWLEFKKNIFYSHNQFWPYFLINV